MIAPVFLGGVTRHAGGHRWWRIRVTANNGDTGFTQMSAVQMRSSIGGSNLCSGGTASASSQFAPSGDGSPASGFLTTLVRWLTVLNSPVPSWLAYQFATRQSIVEIVIGAAQNPPSGNNIVQPKDFSLEWSDDGSSWTTFKSWTGQTGWTFGSTRTFN